uniref:Uncharacterized protein n=1 Tax=Rhizophora mucronata TaxID=61149 RepID=A0A2P2QPB3_RHIMU
MGICFGKSQSVRPLSESEEGVKSSLVGQFPSTCSQRIKVRMTASHLKELMVRVDMSKGNSELGRLILRDSLEGRLGARIVSGEGLVIPQLPISTGLDTIKEE